MNLITEKKKERYHLGKAVVTVFKKSEQTYRDDCQETVQLVFEGEKHYQAGSKVRNWKEQIGKTGMVDMLDGTFLPMHLVSKVKIDNEDTFMDEEVKEVRPWVPITIFVVTCLAIVLLVSIIR